jgi:hypothetical protein
MSNLSYLLVQTTRFSIDYHLSIHFYVIINSSSHIYLTWHVKVQPQINKWRKCWTFIKTGNQSCTFKNVETKIVDDIKSETEKVFVRPNYFVQDIKFSKHNVDIVCSTNIMPTQIRSYTTRSSKHHKSHQTWYSALTQIHPFVSFNVCTNKLSTNRLKNWIQVP